MKTNKMTQVIFLILKGLYIALKQIDGIIDRHSF